MVVRRLHPADAVLAAELAQRFGEPAGDPGTIAAWLADARNVAVAAWEDDRAVGLAYGYHLPRMDERPDGFLLYSLDVVESARRRGVGTRLVEAMRREAVGSMWVVTNEANAAGMAVYQRAGGERPSADDVVWTFEPV